MIKPYSNSRAINFLRYLVVALPLLVFFILSCSSKPLSEPVIPTVTAKEAINLSEVAMASLDSFSFELSHDSGSTMLSSGLNLTHAAGVITRNGLDLEAEANIGRAFVRIEAVVINEKTWMTNPLTGTWSEIPPEDSPFSFFDPVSLVADILGKTQSPQYPLDSPPDGELIINGLIPATTLVALIGVVDPNAVPEVTLTLDTTSYLLQKIIITGVAQVEDDDDTTRVISLGEFNSQVTLKPPI